VCLDHSTAKIIWFWLKFQLNGKTVMNIKYYKLNMVVWFYAVMYTEGMHGRS